jgi:hypothetical protein
MRSYRRTWRAVVTLLVTTCLVAGVLGIGWWAMFGSVAAMACLGVAVGIGWTMEPCGRLRPLVLGAGIGAGLGVLVVGLSTLVGPWTLLVLLLVGLSWPAAVEKTLSLLADRRGPERGADDAPGPGDDLEDHWWWTSRQLRDPGLSSAARLRLVQERALLLDQLEHRDPEHFALWLDRVGRRQS